MVYQRVKKIVGYFCDTAILHYDRMQPLVFISPLLFFYISVRFSKILLCHRLIDKK